MKNGKPENVTSTPRPTERRRQNLFTEVMLLYQKRLGLDLSLYTILQILSVTIFEKTPLVQLFSQTDYKIINPHSPNQLLLFD